MNGRYVDLHLFHRAFVNAAFGRQLDYLAFLDQLTAFEAVPRGKKFHPKYAGYLEELFGYLSAFHAKTRPLTFLAPALKHIDERFEAAWEQGQARARPPTSERTSTRTPLCARWLPERCSSNALPLPTCCAPPCAAPRRAQVPGWADRGLGTTEAPEGTLDLDVFESPEARQNPPPPPPSDERTRRQPCSSARA